MTGHTTAWLGLATIGLGDALSAGASGARVDETLRYKHFLPPMGSVPRFFMEPWEASIEEASGGWIDVKPYPAMQSGDAQPALYDQIRDGAIDCGWALPACTPSRFPEAETMELPFTTSLNADPNADLNAEDASRADWEFSEQYLIDTRFASIHVVAAHVHRPGVTHISGGAVETAADLEGMPVPAFPEALSRGVVDGGVIPWQMVPALRVEELATDHAQIGGARALHNTFFTWLHLGHEPRCL